MAQDLGQTSFNHSNVSYWMIAIGASSLLPTSNTNGWLRAQAGSTRRDYLVHARALFMISCTSLLDQYREAPVCVDR